MEKICTNSAANFTSLQCVSIKGGIKEKFSSILETRVAGGGGGGGEPGREMPFTATALQNREASCFLVALFPQPNARYSLTVGWTEIGQRET